MQFSIMMNKTKFDHHPVVVQKLAPATKPKTDKPKYPAAKKEETTKETKPATTANFTTNEGKRTPAFGQTRAN